MTDEEMIEKLRKDAEAKALAHVLMEDIQLVPDFIAKIHPDAEKGFRNEQELEFGTLAIAAQLIEGTYEGDPLDISKLTARLLKMAESQDDLAWREDSEADDKRDAILYGFENEDDEDEDDETEEDHREMAESARGDAAFYRLVAERLEGISTSP